MTTFLVMAKAPIPGFAKTRLSPAVSRFQAASLAAAALLDTLDAVASVATERPTLALAGSLSDAVASRQLTAAVRGWIVLPQHGNGFAERLTNAHLAAGAGGRPVVQIGMDTPQVTAGLLEQAAAALEIHDVGIGPAADGGWWVLARRAGVDPRPLTDVPMSTPHTFALTAAAFRGRGATVTELPEMVDVDTVDDAAVVAQQAPTTRFGALARALLQQSWPAA